MYQGSYVPLRGVHMSEAYESTIALSFDVRAGLVVRQIHHWTADIFAAAIVVHLCRIFFTGAFRRPREINWIIGVTMFILVIFNGFAGYSLPDDLLSATGLRIAYSILISIPFVGTWLASLFFGGAYPGPATIDRLFIIHVLILPALIAVLLGVHLAIIWRQKHTQFPGPGAPSTTSSARGSGRPTRRSPAGLFAAVFAVVAALGGLAQINPLWLYGPYRTGAVTTAAQPDWYMGWLEGALRIFPAWRMHLLDHTISELFWPGVVLPGLTFALLYAWPFIEAKVTARPSKPRAPRPSPRTARSAPRSAPACSPSTSCSSAPDRRTSSPNTSTRRSRTSTERSASCSSSRRSSSRPLRGSGATTSCGNLMTTVSPTRIEPRSPRRRSNLPAPTPSTRSNTTTLRRSSFDSAFSSATGAEFVHEIRRRRR